MIKIPHVVVEGKLEGGKVFENLEPILIKQDNLLIRTTNSFISKDESMILVETLVIEEGIKSQFFAVISERDDGIVIRIYPGTDVEKTNGVKKSLADLGKQILQKFPETKIGKTNLSEFL